MIALFQSLLKMVSLAQCELNGLLETLLLIHAILDLGWMGYQFKRAAAMGFIQAVHLYALVSEMVQAFVAF